MVPHHEPPTPNQGLQVPSDNTPAASQALRREPPRTIVTFAAISAIQGNHHMGNHKIQKILDSMPKMLRNVGTDLSIAGDL